MAEIIPFGVGCFHFRPIHEPPFTLTLEGYEADITEALEAIPSITNIAIDIDKEFDFEIEVLEKAPILSDGGPFLPQPDFMNIRFDLYIPFRIQEKIAGPYAPDEVLTENFRVDVVDAHWAPVSFVEPLAPTGECDPSTAVRLVREYLEEQIITTSEKIGFDFLGPSPFHAEFYLVPTTERIKGFRMTEERIPGYHRLIFRYDESKIGNPQIAKEELIQILRWELGLYYCIESRRSGALTDWRKLEKTLTQLIGTSGKTERINRVSRFFKRGRTLNHLFTELASFEADEILTQHEIEDGYRSTYARSDDHFLQSHVDIARKEMQAFPVRPVAELAKFFEKRRSRNLELVILLLASLIGGAAGAVITMLLTARAVAQ